MDDKLDSLRMDVKRKILANSEEFLAKVKSVTPGNIIDVNADLRHLLGAAEAFQAVVTEILKLQGGDSNGQS